MRTRLNHTNRPTVVTSVHGTRWDIRHSKVNISDTAGTTSVMGDYVTQCILHAASAAAAAAISSRLHQVGLGHAIVSSITAPLRAANPPPPSPFAIDSWLSKTTSRRAHGPIRPLTMYPSAQRNCVNCLPCFVRPLRVFVRVAIHFCRWSPNSALITFASMRHIQLTLI